MDEPLRVAIAEDHYLVREGIRRALEAGGQVEVVAAVGDPVELQESVARLAPAVVVTDIRMPPSHRTEGIDLAHRLRAEHPRIGIVVLSQYAETTYALELLRDGTSGLAYLLKERVGDPDQLVAAVREVAHGGSVIDPDVVATLVAGNTHPGRSALPSLTDRERGVLEQMAQGRTNAAIAGALHLSESSIEKYATSIFAKLHLSDEPQTHRRVTAVLAFLRDAGRAQPL
ncbi:response regulator transcription factor [Nitriliruptor alkaliphilus]|uniref:response regulator transcription factor n=1 Tax=Nitriliruptor alkaliphilus TaxID=427918 RepID=UPI000697B09E|nr:response regulator transcription factor [Nitriliruptor alkaliphilus]